MTTQEAHAPTLGPPGEACAECATPLAPDQRYCLECGARRAQVPGPLAPPPSDGAVVTRETVVGGDPERRANTQLLAGLGCLLLALGIGVIIGRADDSSGSAPAPPLQVVTVSGGAAAPAAASTGGDGAAKATAKKPRKRSGSKESAAKSTGDRGAATTKLRQLESLSPEQYQKRSQKLPKTVGTGGKPAKIDPAEKKKPAGAGSEVESIG